MGRGKRSRKSLLVKAYAERIPRKVLEKHRKSFKQVVGRKSGIYALRDGDGLYYVGIARSLRSRLRIHLRDRHSGGWDNFSFYSIGRKRYLREIEAILIRVARPPGNTQKGRFGRKKDIRQKLLAEILRSERELFNI